MFVFSPACGYPRRRLHALTLLVLDCLPSTVNPESGTAVTFWKRKGKGTTPCLSERTQDGCDEGVLTDVVMTTNTFTSCSRQEWSDARFPISFQTHPTSIRSWRSDGQLPVHHELQVENHVICYQANKSFWFLWIAVSGAFEVSPGSWHSSAVIHVGNKQKPPFHCSRL